MPKQVVAVTRLLRRTGCGLLVLLLILLILPCRMSEYRCAACAAYRVRLFLCWLPVLSRVHESVRSDYWRHLDSSHVHSWVETECTLGSALLTTRHRTYRAWGNFWFQMPDECAVAVLKSMPSDRCRRAFASEIYDAHSDPDHTLYEKASQAQWELSCAYYDSPDRKDWPQLLRKLGYWPREVDTRR